MATRAAWAILISGLFASVLYTTNGCGGTPTETFHLASLTGLVSDSVSGQPIVGASLTIQHAGATPFTTTTGPDGRYFVTGLPTGDARVDVTAAGHRPVSAATNLVDGSNTLNIQLAPLSP